MRLLKPTRIDPIPNFAFEQRRLRNSEVATLLKENGLSELNIEADAVLSALPTLIMLEQLQSSVAARRDKAIAGLAFYRRMREQAVQQPARENRGHLAPEVLSLTQPPRR